MEWLFPYPAAVPETCFSPRCPAHSRMYPRSRSKAFRNAILWTWWLPLVAAVVAGAVKYVPDRNQPVEWLTTATIRLTLADGGVPDKGTMEAHVKILQSSTVTKSAEAKVKEAYPDLHSFLWTWWLPLLPAPWNWCVERLWPGVQSGFQAVLLGGGYGIVFMLLVSGLWAFFRPGWIQPSLEKIMKAAEALDPPDRTALLELLEGGASGEAGSRGAA